MNKTILIAGATHGVGRALAEKLLDMGNKVIGVDKLPSDLKATNYAHIICDFAAPSFEDDLMKKIKDVPDKFVYAAATPNNTDSLSPNSKKIQKLFHVNLVAPWIISSLLLKKAIESESNLESVVLVSSVHAYATSKNRAAYAASKASLCSLARSLAIDYAKYKTRVNVVALGAVRTNMLTGLSSDELNVLEKRLLTGNVPQPEHVLGTIIHLLSNDSEYVTGQTFIVDGGAMCQLASEI